MRSQNRIPKLATLLLSILILALLPISASAMGKGGSGGTGGTGGSGGTGGTGGGGGADHDVVIVGAGAAGMYAAFELNNLGFDVLVLEGRGRRGGRLEPKMQGTVEIDEHAEGVTGTRVSNWHTTDIDKLDKNRLTELFLYTADDDTLMSVGGTTVLGSEVTKKGDPDADIYDYWDFYYSAEDYSGPDIDVETYMCDTLGICRGHQAYHLYDSGFPGGEYSTSPGRMGMRSLAEQESLWQLGVGEWGFTAGTWLDTADELYFNQINHLIQLNSRVDEIDTSGAVAVVEYNTNQTVTANAVLVTVTLGNLKAGDIAFTPGLPQAKLDAINNIGMGNGGKLFLEFSTAFWPSGTTGWFTEGPGTYCWSQKYKGGDGDKVLACFPMGENAEFLESLGSEAAALAQTVSDLDTLYPGTPFADTFVGGFWGNGTNSQFLKGVYSYPRIGTYPTDGSPSMREVLAEKVGTKLYFAGEATDNNHSATVFGALDSGLRASGEIDADHNPQ